MNKKKKYYIIGIILLAGAIVGYHYLAAWQAAQQIDKGISEQVKKRKNLSVQYSSIDIAPFAATVSFRDLTVIVGEHMERARDLKLDIGYLDFLNIYLGGLQYGLDHLTQARITTLGPSYLNKKELEEIKFDTLEIIYSGNALDGLQSAVNGIPFQHSQKVEARSAGLTISLPQTPLHKIKAQSFSYTGHIGANETNFWTRGTHRVSMDSLQWTPSKSFQNSYSFFIKGFGYSTDAIPFKYARLRSEPASQPNTLKIAASVSSELALFSGSGFLQLHTPVEASRFRDTQLTLTDLSQSFSNVLKNIERLFSFNLPRQNESISLQLKGTLSKPAISH